jgi:hypothetical protein
MDVSKYPASFPLAALAKRKRNSARFHAERAEQFTAEAEELEAKAAERRRLLEAAS